MINFDKYREEIMSEIRRRNASTNPAPCAIRSVHRELECFGTKCGDCSFRSLEWLFQEYEPPLLENGDGLNPGDWIMVRYYTADKWHKRQFMCFYNGVFYTAEGPFDMVGHHTFSRWHDARLPEEGE